MKNLIRGVGKFSKGLGKNSRVKDTYLRAAGSDLERKRHFSIPPRESVDEYFLKNF